MINDLTRYNQIRDRIRTGDDIQFASFSMLGLAIRFVTGAPVNHVAKVVILTDQTGAKRICIVEAMENGMQTRYLSERLQQFSGVVYWCPIRSDFAPVMPHFPKAIAALQDRMDIEWVKYDYWSIIRQLFGRVGQDASQMFCSEAAWMVTEDAVNMSGDRLAMHIILSMKARWGGKAPNPGDIFSSGLYQNSHQIM